LGGGAVTVEGIRERLAARAFTVWIEVDVDVAWVRVRGSGRPLARDEGAFRELFERRAELYLAACDGIARDADGVLLEALGVVAEPGVLADLEWFAAGRTTALIGDERVLELHDPDLGGETHAVPSGEAAKRLDVVERLWDDLRVGRDGVVVALGGGTATDVAGFVA